MTLPKLMLEPDGNAFTISPGSEFQAVKVAEGPSRRRSDFIGAVAIAQIQFVLDADEYSYIMAFYRYSIRKGVLPFTLGMIFDDADWADYTVALVPDTFGLAGQSGDAYTVKMQVEVTPRPTDDMADAATIELFELYGDGYSLALDDLAKLVNVNLPNALPG